MNEVKEYFKKWDSVCRMYNQENPIHCHETLLIFAKNYHEEQVKNLIIPDVGSTFAVEFAQYIAEEHYRLVNVENGTYYWKDETSLRTTEQLLERFKNTRQ